MPVESSGSHVLITIDQPLALAEMMEVLAELGLRLATPEEIQAFVERPAGSPEKIYTLTDHGVMPTSD